MLPQEFSTNRNAAGLVAEPWDPYDVWLKRVKLPRERTPARAVVVTLPENTTTTPTHDAAADGSLLLPGIS